MINSGTLKEWLHFYRRNGSLSNKYSHGEEKLLYRKPDNQGIFFSLANYQLVVRSKPTFTMFTLIFLKTVFVFTKTVKNFEKHLGHTTFDGIIVMRPKRSFLGGNGFVTISIIPEAFQVSFSLLS